MVTPNLRTIDYRDGLVRFRIPADWREESEAGGGNMYYAPGQQCGTLRLNVTTTRVDPGSPIYPVDALKILEHFAKQYGVPIQAIQPSVAMICFNQLSNDKGQAILLRCWQFAHAASELDLRIALFTFTLPDYLLDDALTRAELRLLETEICAVKFAPLVGET